MTKHEAAVITAFTGTLFGEFDDFHRYAQKLLDTPIFTHSFGDPKVWASLKEAARPEFIALMETITEN